MVLAEVLPTFSLPTTYRRGHVRVVRFCPDAGVDQLVLILTRILTHLRKVRAILKNLNTYLYLSINLL